jgi:hypothetical protein
MTVRISAPVRSWPPSPRAQQTCGEMFPIRAGHAGGVSAGRLIFTLRTFRHRHFMMCGYNPRDLRHPQKEIEDSEIEVGAL